MMSRSGDVVLVDLGDTSGHEQAGIRPAIFLHTEGNVSLLIPLSGNTKRLGFGGTQMIDPDSANGLVKSSVALVFQMRAVDVRRILKRVGTLAAKDRRAVNKILSSVAHISS